MTKTSSKMVADRRTQDDARTARERHGDGELVTVAGVPVEATGCILPDGSRVVATCLTLDDGIPDGERVWARPCDAGSPLRRRGYLRIVPGRALGFIDAPEADLPASQAGAVTRSDDALGDDLLRSDRARGMVRGSELFARLLYAGLCNTTWMRVADGTRGSMSWRWAGSLVARLRGEGDYADWYCAGGEGTVDEVVMAELQLLGWDLSAADPPDR